MNCKRKYRFKTVEKPQLKITSFESYKHGYLIRSKSDKGFKGTVVNLVLPLLEITLTVLIWLLTRDVLVGFHNPIYPVSDFSYSGIYSRIEGFTASNTPGYNPYLGPVLTLSDLHGTTGVTLSKGFYKIYKPPKTFVNERRNHVLTELRVNPTPRCFTELCMIFGKKCYRTSIPRSFHMG